ncbi:MAG: hypothetical protein LBN27_06030 [Prevotellaceae bacterium]|jgi:hypothetical protein|nr:hypothetical protein [Prevotellaceae bacterium]
MNTKKLLLFLVGAFISTTMFGAVVTSKANGNWNAAGTWDSGAIPAADDDVIIQNTVTINVASTCKSVTINSGELKWQNNNYNITVNGDFTINNGGKFTHSNNAGGPVYLYGDFVYNGGTYDVTTDDAPNVIIHLLKAGSKITGTSATELHFMNLTINPPSAADTIYLDRENITINSKGTLTLAKGTFKVGATNSLIMGTNQAVTLDASGGGNFATTGENGIDGGNVICGTTSGGLLTIKGTGAFGSPTFYNLYRGNTAFATSKSGNWKVKFDTEGVLINGTFSNTDLIGTPINEGNQWAVDGGGKSPVYGTLSSLIVSKGNQPYNPGKEWTSITPATIGVTPGYPNNVLLNNMGTSSGDNCGFNMPALAINGTLTLGLPNATNNNQRAFVLLDNKTIYCGGLTINAGSFIRPKNTSTIYVGGDWNLLGGTGNVNLYPVNTPTLSIKFNGNRTAENPQLIYNSNGLETFGSGNNVATVEVINSYIKLNTPVEINKTLTLTANTIVETSATKTLTIKNINSLLGGSETAYINGAVTAAIAAGTTYFPMGKGENYFPITFTADAATTVTVEAILGDCGGTPDTEGETPVYLLDDAKYWKVTATSDITLSYDVLISTMPDDFDKIVASNTLNGTYGVIDENISGTEFYFTFASSTPPDAELYLAPEEGAFDFGTLVVQDKGQNTLNITGKYIFHNLIIEIQGEDADAFTLVGSLDGILEVPYRQVTTLPGTNIGIVFNIDKALANKTYSATLVIRYEEFEERVPITGTMNVSSTGLNDTDADNATAYIIDGVLHIDNLPAGEVYGIYNVQGQQITAGKGNGASIAVNFERKGIYIVVAGKKAIKIIG